MARFLSFLFILLLSTSAIGNPKLNEWNLRGGLGLGTKFFSSFTNKFNAGWGPSFMTQLAHRYERWELGVGSFASYAEIPSIQMVFRGTIVSGDARLRTVTFGPFAKYFLPYDLISKGEVYFLFGGLAGLQSLKFQSPDIAQNGDFNPDRKIALDSYGLFLSTGYERINEQKNQSWFVDVSYQYLQARKLTDVGGSNTKIEQLHTNDEKSHLEEHIILLSLGKIFI